MFNSYVHTQVWIVSVNIYTSYEISALFMSDGSRKKIYMAIYADEKYNYSPTQSKIKYTGTYWLTYDFVG